MNGTNQLFVGGDFTSVNGYSISANYVASWNGNSWNILGSNSTNSGVNGSVQTLAMNGTNNLFVGGSFTSVAGNSISANNIAAWDGNSWYTIVNGLNEYVKAIAINSTNIVLGGTFTLTPDGFCEPYLIQGKQIYYF